MSEIVVDAIGQKHEAKNYERIISLIPSITETLFELGVGENIVGVTKWCVYPPEAQEPPRTIIPGGTKNPSKKVISQLNPDLIFMSKEENRKKSFEELKEIAPVFVVFPQTVEESIKMVQDLAILLKRNEDPTSKQKLEKMLSNVEKIKKIVSEKPERKVFVPVWKNPWMTFGKDTYMNSFFATLKLRNIFDDKERYPTVTLDEIRNRKPDLILLPSEPCRFTEEDKLFLSKETGVPLKNIMLIEGSYVTWYGIRTALGLEKIAKILYPNEF